MILSTGTYMMGNYYQAVHVHQMPDSVFGAQKEEERERAVKG